MYAADLIFSSLFTAFAIALLAYFTLFSVLYLANPIRIEQYAHSSEYPRAEYPN